MNSIKTFLNKVGDRVREGNPEGGPVVEGLAPKGNLVEGFVCPTCFKKFECPDALETHYEDAHMNPSANYLCPVCQARLSSQKDLELHYSSNHKEKDLSNHSLELLKDELIAVTSSLGEERWHSEELKKEVERLHEAFQKKDSDESDIYIHKFQLDAAEEAKSTLSSEVMHLRKQLSEALQHTGVLLSENQTLEGKLSETATEKNSLLCRIEDFQAEMESYKHFKEEAHKVVEKLKEDNKRIEELEEEVKSFQVEQERNKTHELTIEENEHLKRQIDEKEEEVKISQKNVQNLKNECEMVRDNLTTKNEEVNGLTAKLTAKEKILQEFQTSIKPSQESMKPENAQLLQEYTDKITHLDKQNKAIATELEDAIKQKLDAMCSSRDKADKVLILEQELTQLQSAFDQIKTAFKKAKDSGLNSETAIGELKTQNVILAEEKNKMESECRKLDSILNQAQKLEGKAKEEVAKLESELSGAYESNLLKCSELEDRQAEVVKLKEAQDSLLAQFDEIVGKLTSKDTILSLLESEKESILSESYSQMSKIETLQNELVVLARDADKMKTHLEKRKDAMTSLDEELATCRKEKQEEKYTHARAIKILEDKEESSRSEIKQLIHQGHLTAESEERFKKMNKNLANELQQAMADIISARESCDLVIETNTAYHDRIKENEVTLSELKTRVTELQNELSDVTVKLEDAESGWKCESAKVAVLDEKIGGLEAELAGLAGDKLELEVRIEAASEERQGLLNRCVSSEKEVERLQQEINLLRRKLEASTAALHDLGLTNQSLQIETVKQAGRKWAEDSDVINCTKCAKNFTVTVRRHHCRNCGQIFCKDCSSKIAPLESNKRPVRVCDSCHVELISKV